MSRPKAALLAAHVSPNDARLAKQCAALESAGWQVDILSWVSETGHYSTLPQTKLIEWRHGAGVAISQSLPQTVKNLTRAAAQRASLQSALIKGGYGAVISSDPETLRPAAIAKQRGGYALLYDAHEYYPDEVPDNPARGRWVDRVHKAAAPKIDTFMTVNEAIAELYGQTDPALGPAHVIRNASPRRPSVHDDGRLRNLAGIKTQAPIVLYQGGFARDRGLVSLVEAMTIAPHDWVLVMMGSGALEASLREQAGPRVIFVAPQKWDELYLWTAGAALGAVLYEGTCANQRLCSPNKLWEYPAAGVPLLASDLPYLGKVVRENHIGLTVSEAATPQAICAALAQATPEALTLACAAAAVFSASTPWETEADRFVDHVISAARASSRSSRSATS